LLQRWLYDGDSWQQSTLSTNGYFANISHEYGTAMDPKIIWTDQGGEHYTVTLQGTSIPKTLAANQPVYHRRLVMEDAVTGHSLAIEIGEFEVTTASGEHIALGFPKVVEDTSFTFEEGLSYLSPGPIALPAEAKDLRYRLLIYTGIQQDSAAKAISAPFNQFSFGMGVKESPSGAQIANVRPYRPRFSAVLADTVVNLDIRPLAGETVRIFPIFANPPIGRDRLILAMGHIWIEQMRTGKPAEGRRTAPPAKFVLLANYPNPFNPSTVIRYQLPERARVSLAIYDLRGREVARLVEEAQPAGGHQVRWDAREVPSGVYFCRLEARSLDGKKSFSAVHKLVLVR